MSKSPFNGFAAEFAPRDAVDRGVRAVLIGLFLMVAITIPAHLSAQYLDLVTKGMAYSVGALSLVVLVGLVGQFSLAQAGFMGVGAFTAAHLVSGGNVPFVIALPLGGLAAVPVGMLAAIPALRVSGVYLAVVTLSFGEVLQKLFFDSEYNGGTLGHVALPRPGALQDGIHYFWFELFVLMALIAFVCMFRTRRTGRNLAAVRESEAAALSVGINTTRAKITAFGVSAFIAGIGGVLYSAGSGVASPDSFTPFDSIALLSVAVIGGLGSAAGAVAAGLFKTVTPVFIKDYIPFGSSAPELAGVAFGAGLVVQLLTAPLGVTSNLLVAERRLAGVVRFALRRQTAHPAASIEVIN
ncbi:MAG TPA: branched-chain amino acid ABC transporter permease [Candidatus Dormibacteraeota bacterium]|nr:branched-chain amino acid ABC transporter permease [Candidatus Dormibacteraeota bacterium]